jgi:hypothetical protein
MEYAFLNELAESRLFRYRDDFSKKKARELADLLFSTVLLLEILRHKHLSTAREYANRTMAPGEFDRVRTAATDLSNLISVLGDQEKFDADINTDFKVSVPMLQLKRYLRDLAAGKPSGSFDREFLLRLEDYLNVSDGTLKNLRRTVAYWHSATVLDKKTALETLLRGIRSTANQLDLHLLSRHKL